MELFVTISGYAVGLPLELLVIAALLHGGYREFPTVFAYIIAEFLTTVLEMPLALAWNRTHDPHIGSKFVFWYWVDDAVLKLLLFTVVLSLIWQATKLARSGRALRGALSAGTVLFVSITFLVHYNPRLYTGEWMTPWAQKLDVAAAVLDMLLWLMLIAQRHRDPRLLMLSGGLGIMFAGEAIGESLCTIAQRHHYEWIALSGNLLIVVTNLARMYAWWQTLRVPRAIPLAVVKLP